MSKLFSISSDIVCSSVKKYFQKKCQCHLKIMKKEKVTGFPIV